jgi:hypothetical protein
VVPENSNLSSSLWNSSAQSPSSFSFPFCIEVITRSKALIGASSVLDTSPGCGRTPSLMITLNPGFRAGTRSLKVFMAYLSDQLWKIQHKTVDIRVGDRLRRAKVVVHEGQLTCDI